jgi:hypothetical protein
MKALCTCPSDPMMKLTRTFKSSARPCNSGSGVSKASGGRTSPHFGKANGSDTGENSEMWAGTRRKFFSNCPKAGRCGITVDAGVTAHQARTPPNTASDTTVETVFLTVSFALGQIHCIGMTRAIRLPALPKKRVFTLNHLVAFPVQTVVSDAIICIRSLVNRWHSTQQRPRPSNESLRQAQVCALKHGLTRHRLPYDFRFWTVCGTMIVEHNDRGTVDQRVRASR